MQKLPIRGGLQHHFSGEQKKAPPSGPLGRKEGGPAQIIFFACVPKADVASPTQSTFRPPKSLRVVSPTLTMNVGDESWKKGNEARRT